MITASDLQCLYKQKKVCWRQDRRGAGKSEVRERLGGLPLPDTSWASRQRNVSHSDILFPVPPQHMGAVLRGEGVGPTAWALRTRVREFTSCWKEAEKERAKPPGSSCLWRRGSGVAGLRGDGLVPTGAVVIMSDSVTLYPAGKGPGDRDINKEGERTFTPGYQSGTKGPCGIWPLLKPKIRGRSRAVHLLTVAKWLQLGRGLPPSVWPGWKIPQEGRDLDPIPRLKPSRLQALERNRPAPGWWLVRRWPDVLGRVWETSFYNLWEPLEVVVFFVSLQPTEHEVALLSVSYENKSWKLKGHTQFQLPRGESDPNIDILSQVERQIPGHLRQISTRLFPGKGLH